MAARPSRTNAVRAGLGTLGTSDTSLSSESATSGYIPREPNDENDTVKFFCTFTPSWLVMDPVNSTGQALRRQ